VDFKNEGDLAIAMSIISALQLEIQASFDAVDA
jgi:hypothetical protein